MNLPAGVPILYHILLFHTWESETESWTNIHKPACVIQWDFVFQYQLTNQPNKQTEMENKPKQKGNPENQNSKK